MYFHIAQEDAANRSICRGECCLVNEFRTGQRKNGLKETKSWDHESLLLKGTVCWKAQGLTCSSLLLPVTGAALQWREAAFHGTPCTEVARKQYSDYFWGVNKGENVGL